MRMGVNGSKLRDLVENVTGVRIVPKMVARDTPKLFALKKDFCIEARTPHGVEYAPGFLSYLQKYNGMPGCMVAEIYRIKLPYSYWEVCMADARKQKMEVFLVNEKYRTKADPKPKEKEKKIYTPDVIIPFDSTLTSRKVLGIIKEYKGTYFTNERTKISAYVSGKSISKLLYKSGIHKLNCLIYIKEIFEKSKPDRIESPQAKSQNQFVEKIIWHKSLVSIDGSTYEFYTSVKEYMHQGKIYRIYSGQIDIKKPLNG